MGIVNASTKDWGRDRVDNANVKTRGVPQPAASLDAELDSALRAMEASFHVRLIGTFTPTLVFAPAGADARSWLADNYLEFDQFPVQRQGATVGVLDRRDHPAGACVAEVMTALHEDLIVSADMPLADLIPVLHTTHYRLIVRGGHIDGLVTQSDLLKLPVRMLLFGLLTHLELCLRELIRQQMRPDDWLALVDPRRRLALGAEVGRLQAGRFDLNPLEVTNLSDVIAVLEHKRLFNGRFRTEMDEIRKLRNSVAHAKTYVASPQDVVGFAKVFASIRAWIFTLSQQLGGRRQDNG